MINLLIDHGAEVGLVDKLGRTPLHRSARLGYGAATKLLVDRGTVVKMEDNDRRTACDLAEGSDRVIKALTVYPHLDEVLMVLAGPLNHYQGLYSFAQIFKPVPGEVSRIGGNY